MGVWVVPDRWGREQASSPSPAFTCCMTLGKSHSLSETTAGNDYIYRAPSQGSFKS